MVDPVGQRIQGYALVPDAASAPKTEALEPLTTPPLTALGLPRCHALAPQPPPPRGFASWLFHLVREHSRASMGVIVGATSLVSLVAAQPAEAAKANGNAKPPKVHDANVSAALKAVDGSASSIASARKAITSAPLSAKERIAAFKYLNESVPYRNQRNTAGIGDTMCNVTSMAMAFNGLGVGTDESSKEFEHTLASKMSSMGLKRTEEKHRETLAAAYGIDARTTYTPKTFASGAAARQWYEAQVLPELQKGNQATMSINVSGASGHVMRVEWVEAKGLRVDDPYGMFGGLNGTDSQSGNGNSQLISWDDVATMNAGKYVQLYSK